MHIFLTFSVYFMPSVLYDFSALTPLIGWQEGHPTSKN